MSLTPANIPLIDTSKASWEQIFELRKNTRALGKLRKLKIFLQDDYQGKEKDYIENDLAMRLDKYSDVCRDHGLENQSLPAANGAGCQTPANSHHGWCHGRTAWKSTAGLSAAVSIELGQVVLEVATRKHSFNKFRLLFAEVIKRP